MEPVPDHSFQSKEYIPLPQLVAGLNEHIENLRQQIAFWGNHPSSSPEKLKSLQEIEAKVLDTHQFINGIEKDTTKRLKQLDIVDNFVFSREMDRGLPFTPEQRANEMKQAEADYKKYPETNEIIEKYNNLKKEFEDSGISKASIDISQVLSSVQSSVDALQRVMLTTTNPQMEINISLRRACQLSKFFEQSLKSGMNEAQSHKLTLDTLGYHENAVIEFVKYIVTDTISITDDNVFELLELADANGVEPLIKECIKHIESLMNKNFPEIIDHIPDLLSLSMTRGLRELTWMIADHCMAYKDVFRRRYANFFHEDTDLRNMMEGLMMLARLQKPPIFSQKIGTIVFLIGSEAPPLDFLGKFVPSLNIELDYDPYRGGRYSKAQINKRAYG